MCENLDISELSPAGTVEMSNLSKLAFHPLRFTGHEDKYRAGLDRNDRVQPSQGPEGRSPKRQPSPEGLGSMDDDPEHRRCGTLPQPDFAIPGRGTSLSNKIKPTESTNQLISTVLAACSPGRRSWVGMARADQSRRDG